MKAAVPTIAKMIRVVTPVIEEKASHQDDMATMSKKIFTSLCSQAVPDDARVKVERQLICRIEAIPVFLRIID